jgi:hypothetical protein
VLVVWLKVAVLLVEVGLLLAELSLLVVVRELVHAGVFVEVNVELIVNHTWVNC